MTRLRFNLRFAQDAYRCARYPGDLCAELLAAGPRTLDPVPRRWMLLTGLGATAAAAALMLTLLMSRVSDLPRPWPGDPSRGALVDWLPVAPESLPLPKFRTPAAPGHDLALPGLNFSVPPLPDLPSRGVEWLRNAWHSVDAA